MYKSKVDKEKEKKNHNTLNMPQSTHYGKFSCQTPKPEKGQGKITAPASNEAQ